MARRRAISDENEAVGYQGKEFTCIVQTPTMEDIEFMIHDLSDYADEHGLEHFEVLNKGPDPDGGYRAIIVAHNWNPLAWLSERYQARAGGPEARAAVTAVHREYAQKARVARATAVGKERVKTEAEIAAEEEKKRRERRLMKYRTAATVPTKTVPTKTAPITEPELARFIIS